MISMMTAAPARDAEAPQIDPWIEQLARKPAITWRSWFEALRALSGRLLDADAAFDAWLRALTPAAYLLHLQQQDPTDSEHP